MSKAQYVSTLSGQELQQDDINLVAKEAALAEDKAIWALLRVAPYSSSTVARGILPATSLATIAPNGASGTVKCFPFVAVVGSRTGVTGTASTWEDSLDDIRTSVYAVSDDSSTLGHAVALAANSSGNPRWDLVYATMTVDAAGANVTRQVKPPSSASASQSLSVTKVQTLTINVVTGTPGASPAQPALPADSSSNYNIPLAYVRVPTGFGGSSTVLTTDIQDASTPLTLSTTTGAKRSSVATSNASVTSAQAAAWGSSANRTPTYMPASSEGGHEVKVALDLSSGTPANWSHAEGAIIDASTDWRNRTFTVNGYADATAVFAWDKSSVSTNRMPKAGGAGALTPQVSQSFVADGTSYGLASDAMVFVDPQTNFVVVYVDHTTGALKLHVSGTPLKRYFLLINASAAFPNY